MSHGPDDDAVFVDLKTAWIIQGLGHGHQDLAKPGAASAVLARDGDRITANASVVQYNEITPANIASFHFHEDIENHPVTGIIALPHDGKAAVILMGRYQADDAHAQIVLPLDVMNDLLDTVLTVRSYVIAAMGIVALATVATAALVFLLSLRLRRREIETMSKIGGSRSRVAAVLGCEVLVVLACSLTIAAALTALTTQFGSEVILLFVRNTA